MGWLHGVERKLENVVNNVFARAFRSEVEPIEIATRLTKELDSQAPCGSERTPGAMRSVTG